MAQFSDWDDPDFFASIHPARLERIMAEIAPIQRGEGQWIPLHLDPVCAFHLACSLDLALSHPAHRPGPRAILEEIVDGLEARIREQCPELGALLGEARASRKEGAGE